MLTTENLQDAPLGRLVAMAGHLATRRWSSYLSEAFGITPGGAAVLMALFSDGDSQHSHLAQRCAIRAATLTGVVDTLQRAGYVDRVPDHADRRAMRVTLTPHGTSVAEQLHRRANQRDGARALTSIDADPAREEVVREFLIELIVKLSQAEGEE